MSVSKVWRSALFCACLASTAHAECISAYMTTYENYARGQKMAQTQFRPMEMLVLCFSATRSGYVSVFDSPAEGDFEQLYPNAITHPNGETAVEIEANKSYCFGTPETFPMFHPVAEGNGLGKVSINLTQDPELQLSSDDYAIPGQRVARSTMTAHMLGFKSSASSCTERDVKYIEYRIVP